MRSLYLLSFFVLIQSAVVAQVTILKDIANTPASVANRKSGHLLFTNSGSVSYMRISNGNTDEVWRTDGTPGGTFKIAGEQDNLPGIRATDEYNGMLLYVDNYTLHKTTGTVESNEAIKTITTADEQYPGDFTFLDTFDSKKYFSVNAYNPYVCEIWTTDGTEANTTRLKTFDPEGVGMYVTKRIATSQYLYFVRLVYFNDANDNYEELWRTDGTVVGTIPLKTLGPTTSWAIGKLGDEVFFNIDSDEEGKSELWKTDGTVVGTTMVTELESTQIEFVGNDDQLFIVTSQSQAPGGSGIYITDGTELGTELLYEASGYKRVGIYNDKLYAIVSGNPCRIVESDGTIGGTHAEDLASCSDENFEGLSPFQVFKDKFFVSYYSPVTGQELGLSDGTAAGTVIIKDIYPGTESSTPTSFTVLPGGNKAVFLADDGSNGRELWVTDGTEIGTRLVYDLNPGTEDALEPVFPTRFIHLNSLLYFFAIDNSETNPNSNLYKKALWATDGTAEGTVINYKFDIDASFIGLNNENIILNEYYQGQFLKLDGINNESPVLKTAGSSGSDGTAQIFINGKNIFPTATSAEGREFWVSDGTEEGTHILKDINPGPGRSDEGFPPTQLGDSKMIFSAADNGTDFELWSTDGTEGNTVKLKDINPGGEASFPRDLATTANNIVFFSANDGIHGTELWKTDGTPEGTSMVKDIVPGNEPFRIGEIIPFGDNVVFGVHLTTNHQVWISDGTDVGTTLIRNFSIGTMSDPGYIDLGVALNGKFYFAAADDSHGVELWVTDGTDEGTVMFDLVPGAGNSSPSKFTVIEDFVYFAADKKLWRSAGTIESTQMIADYDPMVMTYFNGDVYFEASSTQYGREIFKVPYTKLAHELDFDDIEDMTMGDPIFTLNAKSTQDVPVVFSSNDKVEINGINVTLISPGVASITAESGNQAFETISVTKTFCINPAKPLIVDSNPDPGHVLLTSSAGEGNQWYLNGEPIEGAIETTFLVPDTGNYSVQSTVEGCESEMSDTINPLILGIEDIETQVRVFPNPAAKNITFTWNGNETVGLDIMNIHGQRVYQASFQKQHQVDASNWAAEVYVAKIRVGDSVVLKKIVKQ